MLREMLGAWRRGAAGAKLIQVLGNYYNLDVSHPKFRDMARRIGENFAESLNEHEMAVYFVAEFTRNHVKPDHPQATREVEKYIRVSKAAYEAGLAKWRQPQEDLFAAARERFGIDPDTITAGSWGQPRR